MQEFDVAVVGGGPIGGHVAKKIAKENFNVAIFEKNKKIGAFINCAGLITPKVFDFLEISKDKVIQNKIKGAHIHSPSGHILSIGGDKIQAIVIDRLKFDQEMIKKARENGAELFLNSNVLSIKKNKYVEFKTSNNIKAKCKLLIGADGPNSKVRNTFLQSEPVEYLRGIGAEIIDTNLDANYVEIFVGEKVAPGFFAWIIPTNEKGTSARIGLCISNNSQQSPKYYFKNFFTNKPSARFLNEVEITKNIGGVVPLGAIKKSFDSNVLVVGDAAAQVKPTSGGGIYTGLLCANHCASVSIDAIQKNDFSAQFLKNYHKLWSGEIGREIFLGMNFRKIYKKLSDKQMDKYILKFQDPKIRKIISEYGDIDYPSKLVKPLLKKMPSLLKLLPKVLK